ncbi:MAG: hypothetical protein Q4C50_02290 [Eubacteriales bacterium]|nr:hypothetical protein [Eubacteriales bacterium]
MLKLMKYEFRKTMFSKAILLIITAISEVVFLIGLFFNWGNGLGIGTLGLAMCAMIGIFYIGVESLLVFHRDLNTKQSYMLFLTPKNSYQVLGAKVLENGISIFVTGLFFAALAALDASLAILYLGGLKEFLDMLGQLLTNIQVNINITPGSAFMMFMTVLTSWLLMVVMGYLAIILSATVLAGKRYSGIISFVLYLILGWASGMILDKLPVYGDENMQLVVTICGSLVIIAVMYAAAGWIMERKLSV